MSLRLAGREYFEEEGKHTGGWEDDKGRQEMRMWRKDDVLAASRLDCYNNRVIAGKWTWQQLLMMIVGRLLTLYGWLFARSLVRRKGSIYID